MPNHTLDLQNKIVLLTGASSGIGAALAPVLHERGARLALIGRSTAALAELARPTDLVVAADLTNAEQRAAAVAECLATFGHVDVLINNAGAGAYGSTIRMPDDVVRRVFELNFFALLELCQLAVPHMPPGSLIVNVGSVGGQMILPWMSMYTSAKYAVTALTDCLRVELSVQGIDVMGVYPGHVRTPFQQHSLWGAAPHILSPTRNRFTISSEECARAIVRGMEGRRRTIVIPAIYWLPIWLSRLVPFAFESKLRQIMAQIGSAES
jgi:short-subunit dehydrogenase